MKITEKQLQIMFIIFRHALSFANGFAGFDKELLREIFDEILNQQSDKLIDVKDEGFIPDNKKQEMLAELLKKEGDK